MSRSRERFNLYLHPELREEVRAAAETQDESMAAYIRRAIRMRLQRDNPERLMARSLPECLQPPTS